MSTNFKTTIFAMLFAPYVLGLGFAAANVGSVPEMLVACAVLGLFPAIAATLLGNGGWAPSSMRMALAGLVLAAPVALVLIVKVFGETVEPKRGGCDGNGPVVSDVNF